MKSLKAVFFIVLISSSIASNIICAEQEKTKNLTNLSTDTIKTTTTDKYDEQVYKWLSTLAQVLEITKNKAYKTPDLDELMIKSLDTFMQFDAHGALHSQKEYKSLSDSMGGEFCGIGVKIAPKVTGEDFITVVDVIAQGPAEKAGVKPLDKIIAVDGNKLKKLKLEEIVEKIRGPRKTKVRLDIIRNGNSSDKDNILKIYVERDVVKEENLSSYYLPELKIYYISLAMFSTQSAHLIESVLKKSINNKVRGIILDLRDNGGGILQSAVDISSLFMPKNSTIVVTKNKDGKILESYLTKRAPIAPQDIPIIILVNHGTASAAEILSGTLKSLKNIFILGTQTYGKGSVQEVIPLNNNCAIRCTIAEYFLDNNTKIQGIGVTPDFVVEQKIPPTKEMKLIEELQRSEEQKSKMAEPEETETTKNPKEKFAENFAKDYQIKSAIQIINIFNILKSEKQAKLESKEKSVKFIKKYLVLDDKIKLEEVENTKN